MSYSQSKQDKFALLVNLEPGFYLDVGCSIPKWQNNSRLLLEKGWLGVNIDAQDHSKEWNTFHGAKFIQADATTLNWRSLVNQWTIPKFVDYASIDVDENSFLALKTIIEADIVFSCATVEHDFYRFGNKQRNAQRELMKKQGYVLLVADVSHNGSPYEDWYVHDSVPDQLEMLEEILSWSK